MIPIEASAKIDRIAGIVLAAGLSQRMRRPKMTLPWKGKTVVRQVIDTLSGIELDDLLVITGGAREQVEMALKDSPAKTLFNPDYANGEMLISLQMGLTALDQNVDAALIALGDQPWIEADIASMVISTARETSASLVVPSFNCRRGHPWLIHRRLWDEVLQLKPPATLRDFMRKHSSEILYIEVVSSSILQDLDTPEQYQNALEFDGTSD